MWPGKRRICREEDRARAWKEETSEDLEEKEGPLAVLGSLVWEFYEEVI